MKGRIYKIVNDINDKIYIGSTKCSLYQRLYQHKADSTKDRCKKYRLYIETESLGWHHFKIILIEEIEFQNRDQLHQREQYYIEILKPILNKSNAFGIKMCDHGLQYRCNICSGGSICPHNNRKYNCRICYSIICDECEKPFSKQTFKKHLHSWKHFMHCLPQC